MCKGNAQFAQLFRLRLILIIIIFSRMFTIFLFVNQRLTFFQVGKKTNILYSLGKVEDVAATNPVDILREMFFRSCSMLRYSEVRRWVPEEDLLYETLVEQMGHTESGLGSPHSFEPSVANFVKVRPPADLCKRPTGRWTREMHQGKKRSDSADVPIQSDHSSHWYPYQDCKICNLTFDRNDSRKVKQQI